MVAKPMLRKWADVVKNGDGPTGGDPIEREKWMTSHDVARCLPAYSHSFTLLWTFIY